MKPTLAVLVLFAAAVGEASLENPVYSRDGGGDLPAEVAFVEEAFRPAPP